VPELQFKVEAVEVMASAATPTLCLRLAIANRGAEHIHSVALAVQLQIEPARRRYSPAEKQALSDFFGEPERWASTVRPLFWTTVNAVVPSFAGCTSFDLPVPCSFDFNVAATKYFQALDDGEVAVALLFSGTVFYLDDDSVRVAPIAWSQEASCRIPLRVWQQMMTLHYSNSAWLTLRRDVFERLCRYKVRHGLPTWEQMMEHVLAAAGDRE
jgi:hypothetical protein